MRAQKAKRGWPARAVGDQADEENERYTPPGLVEWCARRAGVERFDLDVAACAESHFAPRYYTKKTNALEQSWACDTWWCNGPFRGLWAWPEKAWAEATAKRFRLGLMLLPAMRQEQPGWQQHVEPYAMGERDPHPSGYTLTPHHPPGRWAFRAPGGVQLDSAGFPLVLLVWRRC